MNLTPPNGSKISVTHDGGVPVIVIPPAEPGYARYAGAAFMIFWLAGWAYGFGSATTEILSGKGGLFLWFWLAAWTVGGGLALVFLYHLLRRSTPELFKLKLGSVVYDSGTPSFKYQSDNRRQVENWRAMFPKRKILELDRRKLESLKLRETEAGNRLTIDADAERLEIAQAASEVEREWLYKLLVSRYMHAATVQS